MRRALGVLFLVAVAKMAGATTPASTPSVETEIKVSGISMKGAALLEMRTDAAQCPGLPPREVTVTVPSVTSIDTSGCSRWTLNCRGKAFCSAVLDGPQLVESSPPVAVEVFPASVVKGRIEVKRPAITPERIKVSGRLRGGTHDRTQLEFAFSTDVSEDRQVAFNVPVGAVDLRVAASEFAPTYRWNVRPQEGVIDLGQIEMLSGGSLLGYVVDADTGSPVPGATITAIRAGIENLSVDELEAIESMTAPAARTTDHGSFQLTSVSPGSYRLRVVHPDYLTVEPAEVSVVGNAETILRGDVVLSRPLRLRVEVDPPVSPSGDPWKVVLIDPVTSEDIETARADASGIADFEGLAPSLLRLVVEAEGASGAFRQDVDLTANLDLPVRIPFVEVIGRVTLDDEPVAGEVEVRTGAGDSWDASLDEDGRFQVWSREPRFDFLFVLVKGEGFELPPLVRVEDLDVKADKVEVAIELFDLELTGTVTSLQGNPVESADIFVQQGDQNIAFADSRPDGSFSVRPLQPGEYRVYASQEGVGSSQYETVALSEYSPAGEARLVIRPSRKIVGFLSGPSGEAIGGARIVAMSSGRNYVLDGSVTDIEGRFVAQVAPESDRAIFIVTARGYPLWSACVSSREEVRLAVVGSGGLLETRVDHGDRPMPSTGQTLLVNEAGGVLPFVEVLRWSMQHGGGDGTNDLGEDVFRVPNVAAGRWAMAWAQEPLTTIVPRSCDGTFFQSLDWATVSPGEPTVLVLDRNKLQISGVRFRRHASISAMSSR